MSTRSHRLPMIVIPLVLSMGFLVLLITSTKSWASDNTQDHISLAIITPTEQPETADDIQIVRVYYVNQEALNRIAARMEPWEVNKDLGYAVVEVDSSRYAWLVNMGLKVEVDQQLTQKYYAQRQISPNQVSGIPGDEYACYKTVEETYAFAESLVITYPTLTEWIDIGDSWEKTHSSSQGHDLYVLKITNKNTVPPKPKLFVMSGLHAREYAPPELNTYFAEYLLENYGIDPDITWLLNHHEIHLLLHANPDGRKYAEDNDTKYWRKNTNENYCGPTSYDRGADLNRNFNFHWNNCDGSDCSSSYDCDETYRGSYAASEPETQAIQTYLQSIFTDQRGELDIDSAPITSTGVFIDLHSFGNLVLWPWGFTYDTAPNSNGLQSLGRKLAFFNQYQPGQSNELYLTDGDSDGFAYGALGLPGYTFEIGTWFFESCTYFQENIMSENLPALLYAAKIARYPYMLPSGPDVINISTSPVIISSGNSIQIQAIINDTHYKNKYYEPNPEPTQVISAAEYYIDTPPWVTATLPLSYSMNVEDGVFDENTEAVTASINTTDLSQGKHMIFIRGQDAAGNWGPISAEFLYIYNQLYYFPIVATP